MEKEMMAEPAEISKAPVKKKAVRKTMDPRTVVTVRNGFQGRLIYVSRKTGETFTFDEFGSEQEMELGELRDAKNSSKVFFANNWFLIDDQDVIDSLGVSAYYDNALCKNGFDAIFKMDPGEIAASVEKLSEAQKESLGYRAKEMYASGTLDSVRVIRELEKSLHISVIGE